MCSCCAVVNNLVWGEYLNTWKKAWLGAQGIAAGSAGAFDEDLRDLNCIAVTGMKLE